MDKLIEMIVNPEYNDFLVPTIDFLVGLIFFLGTASVILMMIRYVLSPFNIVFKALFIPIDILKEWHILSKKNKKNTQVTTSTSNNVPNQKHSNTNTQHAYVTSNNNQITENDKFKEETQHEKNVFDSKIIEFDKIKSNRNK